MKRLFVFKILCVYFLSLNLAQVVPNGNFEQWTTVTYEYPTGYLRTSFYQEFYELDFLTPLGFEKSTNAYHGNYAVKLSTNIIGPHVFFGYLVNFIPEGNSNNWRGGLPITQKPTGIKGYYRGIFNNNDSAIIIVQFKQQNNVMGPYLFSIGTSSLTYIPFSFTFDPPLPVVPDTVQIGFASSNPFIGSPQHGTWIMIDSISFTGITAQPTGMNGSFENWTTDNLTKLNDWRYYSYPDCIFRTIDAYHGNYALKLKNILNPNDPTSIEIGSLGTGRWIQDPVDPNFYHLMKCSAFNKSSDTLVFAYKYFPASNDSAKISLIFKLASDPYFYFWHSYQLSQANTYTIVEFPFTLSSQYDSVCFMIENSLWYHNTSNYLNSELFIDRIFFKSQPAVSLPEIAKNKNIRLYPNPASELLNVEADNIIKQIAITNIEGKQLHEISVDEPKTSINISYLPPGNYLIKLEFDDMIWFKPFLKR